MSDERGRPRPPIPVRIVLPLMLLALYFPLIILVFGSFRDADGNFTLQWFSEVLADPELLEALSRSLIVAIGSSFTATVLGLLGAMALHRWRNRARLFLGWMSYVSLLTPELVLAISLLSWYALLGLRLSLATVVIAHVSLTLPFVIMVIGARLDGLDASLDDAARDLGATDWRILTRVTLPLLKPALVTGFLLAFLLSFDDFMVTFYTNGVGLDTLPVKLYGQMKLGLTPKLQALSTLMLFTSVVLVIVLVLRQKSSNELT